MDIYNRLYRERIVFLGQEIDDEIVNQIIAVMLFADSEDASQPQYLYINSPGGSVIAGLALYGARAASAQRAPPRAPHLAPRRSRAAPQTPSATLAQR